MYLFPFPLRLLLLGKSTLTNLCKNPLCDSWYTNFLGPPFSRPNHILLVQTSPHRWNSHNQPPCLYLIRLNFFQHHSSRFAGPFLSLATPLPSSPLSLIPAHLIHLHVFCLSLPTSSSTDPLKGVLDQADCPGWQRLQRSVWGDTKFLPSPHLAAGLPWSW